VEIKYAQIFVFGHYMFTAQSFLPSLSDHLKNTKWAISELPCASVSKRVFLQNLSNENEFDLHENELVGETRFYMNGFVQRLDLTQKQKATRNVLLFR